MRKETGPKENPEPEEGHSMEERTRMEMTWRKT
jgi:hypothetical protein